MGDRSFQWLERLCLVCIRSLPSRYQRTWETQLLFRKFFYKHELKHFSEKFHLGINKVGELFPLHYWMHFSNDWNILTILDTEFLSLGPAVTRCPSFTPPVAFSLPEDYTFLLLRYILSLHYEGYGFVFLIWKYWGSGKNAISWNTDHLHGISQLICPFCTEPKSPVSGGILFWPCSRGDVLYLACRPCMLHTKLLFGSLHLGWKIKSSFHSHT